uniref:DH domain-containing protein n=1 Tax=Strongyloides stercoralis TaxID=6248 RepID=A0AAF5DKW4_STRER
MSSCGRVKGRRPSLADWSDSMKRYQSMDFEQKLESSNNNYNTLIFEICEDEPNSSGNIVDFVQVTNGITLKDALGPYLKLRGITIDKVDCMLENSNTPIPDNSEAIYLVGRKIFVKGKKGNRLTIKHKHSFSGDSSDMFGDTLGMVKTSLGHNSGAKTIYQLQHSNSSKGILSTSRKLSADAISRKSSFVSSKVVSYFIYIKI